MLQEFGDRKETEESLEENDDLEELEVEIEENSNSDEGSDVETYIVTGDFGKTIQVIKERGELSSQCLPGQQDCLQSRN